MKATALTRFPSFLTRDLSFFRFLVIACAAMFCFVVAWKGTSWWKQRTLLTQAEGRNVALAVDAARVIGQKKYSAAVGRLENLVGKDRDKKVRLAAIEALGAIGRSDSAKVLLPLLDEPDREVASQAAVALGRIGNPVAVEPLCKALEKSPVLLPQLWALGAIGDFAAYETVKRFLDDPDPYVSYNAVQALKKLGTGN